MDTRTAVFFIVIVLLTLTITALEGVYQLAAILVFGFLSLGYLASLGLEEEQGGINEN